MVAYWELPKSHLLVLLAAGLEPLRQFSDGRWRTMDRHFPSEGLARSDIDEMEAHGLIETCPGGVSISDKGRAALQADPTTAHAAYGTEQTAERPSHLPLQ